MKRIDLHLLGPLVALVGLFILGALLNPAFLAPANLSNVLARSAFIGLIAVGMTFVITQGGLDLSVGSMAAFLAGIAIMAMNALAPITGENWGTILIGMGVALAGGLLAGFANGALVTKARIEPFIVTLGTMGIFRSLVTWLADDDMAVGVLEAIAQAGREDEMVVVGGAGMKDIVKRIMDKDPQLPVNVTYPPALISSAIEMTALRFVSNAPMAGRYIIGSQLITPENAEQFYFPDSPF